MAYIFIYLDQLFIYSNQSHYCCHYKAQLLKQKIPPFKFVSVPNIRTIRNKRFDSFRIDASPCPMVNIEVNGEDYSVKSMGEAYI